MKNLTLSTLKLIYIQTLYAFKCIYELNKPSYSRHEKRMLRKINNTLKEVKSAALKYHNTSL